MNIWIVYYSSLHTVQNIFYANIQYVVVSIPFPQEKSNSVGSDNSSDSVSSLMYHIWSILSICTYIHT